MVYRKLFSLLLTPLPHSGLGAGLEGLKLIGFKYGELHPLEGEQRGKSLHASCTFALEIIPFSSPSLPLPFLLPSHQYQLALPHIKGRMGPSQLVLSALSCTLVSRIPKGVELTSRK